MADFDWNVDNIERLRVMVADNWSASVIAAAFGPYCTRNAVVGKIHRLGLTNDRSGSHVGTLRSGDKPKVRKRSHHRKPPPGLKSTNDLKPRLKWTRPTAIAPPDKIQEWRDDVSLDLPNFKCEPVDFAEMEQHHCHWPLDDGRYCGNKVSRVRYCDTHYRLSLNTTRYRSGIWRS